MKQKIRKTFIIVVAALITGVFFQFSSEKRSASEHKFVFKPSPPPFLSDSTQWADSVFKTMSFEEQIGQLFMVAAYPRDGEKDKKRITELINEYHVGGIIFFKALPGEVAELTKYYQSISRIPLLIAIDGEWGLSMRFENTINYPRQLMLGAITDDEPIYEMGRDIGRQLHLLGIHINFAPVIDLNNNPENPVISSRSFGENRDNVARKGILYMRGMQDERIIAVAKHFPGHGDTDADSHRELPVIHHSLDRLDSIELFPFRALIENGIAGVMVAHLNVLSLDTTPNLPSTLSSLIVDTLLRHEMKFKGLVFTDAMNMKGVTDFYDADEANMMAFQAGNDIILMPDDVGKSIRQIEKQSDRDPAIAEKVTANCTRILKAKEWAVLPDLNKKPVNSMTLADSLNSPYFDMLRRKLVEKSITLVEDKNGIIPFLRLDTLRFAALSLGGVPENEFQNTLAKYAQVYCYHISGFENFEAISATFDSLRNYNLVIVSIHSNDLRATRQFGVNDRLLEIADGLLKFYPVILNSFANPYLLEKLKFLDKNLALIVSYENDSLIQNLSAQMMFGAFGAEGRLPVSIGNYYKVGTGIDSYGDIRLKYTTPLEAGFNSEKLKAIDSLVKDAIKKEAMPGCQVLAARNGKVFWEKSYGSPTYKNLRPVENDDIYDLASLTKIAATLPAIMLFDQNGLIDISNTLSEYLPELDTTNKDKIKIRDILLHQAGLTAWIPFYVATLEPMLPGQTFSNNKLSAEYPIQYGKSYYVNKHLEYKKGYFSHTQTGDYTIEVAENLYMNPILIDSIYTAIYNSEIEKPGKYKYSDLGFYLLRKLVEKLSNESLDRFVDSCFYEPLGAGILGFKPLDRFGKEKIIPTENDLVFRKQLVQGYVHDPGAAMLGGVSGHAGLFSNADDLAKLMQMMLNGGTYGGRRYLSQKIIDKYTSCGDSEKGNRRGLGFDKPPMDGTSAGPTFKGISPDSFGHTGFTGTMVWADPSTGILFIFLSNRVYPDAINNKLMELNVRTNIQKAIYDARMFNKDD